MHRIFVSTILLLSMTAPSCGSTAFNPDALEPILADTVRFAGESLVRSTFDKPGAPEAWAGIAVSIENVLLPTLAGDAPSVDPIAEWVADLAGPSIPDEVKRVAQFILNLAVGFIPPDWLSARMDASETGAKVRRLLHVTFAAFADAIFDAMVYSHTTRAVAAEIPAPEPAFAFRSVGE